MASTYRNLAACVSVCTALALVCPSDAAAEQSADSAEETSGKEADGLVGQPPEETDETSRGEAGSADAAGGDVEVPTADQRELLRRIRRRKAPPPQVQSAVESVQTTAASVARDLGGADRSDASDEGSETPEGGADVRRIPRATDESDSDEKQPSPDAKPAVSPDDGASPDGLFTAARRLLRSPSGRTLELTPYIDDPRWTKAMDLLVEDKCDKALDRVDAVLDDRPEARDEPAVEYAVARVKMCSGQKAEGRRTMRRLADRDGPVARLAGRRLGHSPAPIDTEKESGEGTMSLAQRIRRAQRAAASGKLADAVGQLAKLRQNVERAWDRYELRMAEAEILLRHDEYGDAARRLLGVYEMTRDWRIGDRVAEKIERIEKRHDLEILPFAARVDRMRELIDRGKYAKARRVSIQNANIAGVSGDEIDGWSAYRKALQAEREKQRERADRLFEKAERLVESPVIRSRLYFGWARALRRLDRDAEAIELYERLCREYPRHHLCDDARFQAGRLHQYAQAHQKARSKFSDVVGLHPNSEHVPQALWLGAFSAYLLGDYAAVDEPLRQIVEHHGNEEDASGLPISLKARYWLGAAAYKRGDLDLAERRLQATINHGALTWYGRLAAVRMERMGARPSVPRPPTRLTNRRLKDLDTLSIPADDRLTVVAEYARLGLYDDAIAELKRQIDVPPVPTKAHRLLASLQLVDGQPHEAHWMMAERIGESSPTIYDLRDWGIAYPVDYLDVAHKWGNRYEVSPFLIQGVVRQESGFRPDVSSWVGAVGLMQLMPGTANVVSDDFLAGDHISRGELQTPETNVRIGTVYLKALMGYVRGRIPLALAGYNAGPAPLDSWFERFGDREVDAWVESITYRQARGYVRKVYTSYVRYSALYGGRLPATQLELPEDFQKWGDVPELQRTKTTEPVSSLQ